MSVPFYTEGDLISLGLSPAAALAYLSNSDPMKSPGDYLNAGNALPENEEQYDAMGNLVNNTMLPAMTLDPNQPIAPPSPEYYNSLEKLAEAKIAAGEPLYEGIDADRADAEQQLAAYNSSVAHGGPGTAHNAMMGVGGPDTPVDNGQVQQASYDPWGGFFSGFASSQAPAYSGGLQAMAHAMGQGSMNMRREMAANRAQLNHGVPSSVKEFNYAQDQGYEGSYMDFKKEYGGNIFGQMMQTMQFNAAEQARQAAAEQRKIQNQRADENTRTQAEQRAWQHQQASEKAVIAADEKAYRKEQKLFTDTQKLDKSIPPEMQEMMNALDNIRVAVSPFEQDDEGNVDLPGYGSVAGSVPGFAMSQKGKDMRATVSSLRNSILKMRSGGAVSDGEASRMLEELAMGVGQNETGMLKSFNRIQADFNKILRKKYNSYPPEVVERYLGKPYEPAPPVYKFKPTQKEVEAEIQRRGL